jgi:hypothetical protein
MDPLEQFNQLMSQGKYEEATNLARQNGYSDQDIAGYVSQQPYGQGIDRGQIDQWLTNYKGPAQVQQNNDLSDPLNVFNQMMEGGNYQGATDLARQHGFNNQDIAGYVSQQSYGQGVDRGQIDQWLNDYKGSSGPLDQFNQLMSQGKYQEATDLARQHGQSNQDISNYVSNQSYGQGVDRGQVDQWLNNYKGPGQEQPPAQAQSYNIQRPDQYTSNEATDYLRRSAEFDPNRIQGFVNPYVEGGLATANKLASRNLTENILPGINSTFTGQGQFGSTRNAEFSNRAVRDTQEAIADANNKAMLTAYGQGSDDYFKSLGLLGQTGQQIGTQYQQGLQNQLGYDNLGNQQAIAQMQNQTALSGQGIQRELGLGGLSNQMALGQMQNQSTLSGQNIQRELGLGGLSNQMTVAQMQNRLGQDQLGSQNAFNMMNFVTGLSSLEPDMQKYNEQAPLSMYNTWANSVNNFNPAGPKTDLSGLTRALGG